MIHIVYFLLLLCCTSTNIIGCVDDFVDFTQNLLHIPTKTESSMPSNTATSNLQQQSTSSSSSAWKYLLKITEKDWKSLSSTAKRIRPTKSLVPSSDEDSIIFDQESDDQENLISEQPSPSDIFTNRAFTTDRLSYPEQSAKNLSISFSSRGRYSLPTASKNTNDFMDLTLGVDVQSKKLGTTKPRIESDDESSTVPGQDFDDQEALVSEQSSSKQRPRKKRKINQKDIPDNAYFIINCIHCSPRLQFKTHLKHNLINSFKKHVEKKHQNITVKQTEIYIKEHLQKPEQFVKFSVHCPKCECILHSIEISNLKKNLFSHILENNKHQSQRKNYSKESLTTYLENNYQQTIVPAQERLKNTQKRKRTRLDVPDNAYFTIDCPICPEQRQFKNHLKSSTIRNFKGHLKNRHPDISEEQTQTYINQHLQEPEQLVKFSVHCPESECQDTLHCSRKENLKSKLSTHVSKQHSENKGNHSKESLTIYVEDNYKQTLVPAQEQLINSLRPVFSRFDKSTQDFKAFFLFI